MVNQQIIIKYIAYIRCTHERWKLFLKVLKYPNSFYHLICKTITRMCVPKIELKEKLKHFFYEFMTCDIYCEKDSSSFWYHILFK